MVQVNRGEEPLDDRDVGLFNLTSLVFHHVVKFGVSTNFNHVEFTIGIFDHDFKELFD